MWGWMCMKGRPPPQSSNPQSGDHSKQTMAKSKKLAPECPELLKLVFESVCYTGGLLGSTIRLLASL